MRLSWLSIAVGGLMALLPAVPAAAHVSVWPREAPAKGFQAFTVRVPTERDSPTVSVRVELPPNLKGVRFQPKPGWKYEVERDASGTIVGATWSGGRIGRDEYEEFHFVARMPEETGITLTFPAHQKYEDGEMVDWVEPEGKRPAAKVQVTAARTGASTAAAEHMGQGGSAATDARPAAATGWVSWAALLVALAALVIALRPARRAA